MRFFHTSRHHVHRKLRAFKWFFIPLIIILFADSFMAYRFPVMVDSVIGSYTVMGFIMGLSSLVGTAVDIILPKVVKEGAYGRMFIVACMFGLIFPISTFLGVRSEQLIWFIIAVACWGTYYELMLFAEQDLIAQEEKPSVFVRDWTLVSLCWHGVILVAPLLAGMLLDLPHYIGDSVGLSVYLLSAICFSGLLWLFSVRKKIRLHSKILSHAPAVRAQYLKLLWIPMVASFCLTAWSNLFWVLGALFGEQFTQHGHPAWIIFVTYAAGVLVGSLIELKLTVRNPLRVALVGLIGAGVSLVPVVWVHDSPSIIYAEVFVAAMLFAIAVPLIDSVFTTATLSNPDDELEIIRLQRIMVSLAFMIFPPLLGISADYFGFASTFSIVSFLVAVTCSLLLYIVWRKSSVNPSR